MIKRKERLHNQYGFETEIKNKKYLYFKLENVLGQSVYWSISTEFSIS